MMRWTRILALGVLVGLVACGDDPAPEPAPRAVAPAETAVAEADEAPEATASNAPPRIEQISFDPEEPAVGDRVRAVVETSDADRDTVWFTYEWTLDGEPVGDGAAELELVGAAFVRGSTLDVAVVASDGKDEDSDSASIEIENGIPRLLTVEMLPGGELLSGQPITLRPNARDADGDDLTFRYEWQVNGREVREDGPVLETERLRRGDKVQAWVIVADEYGESEPHATPVLTVSNSAPQVVSRPAESSNDGTFRYQVEASDPDGDRNLQYHLENEPEGMEIHPVRGSIVWAPGPGQAGAHQVSVIVDDLRGGRTRHTFEVKVAPPGGAPPPASRDAGAQ